MAGEDRDSENRYRNSVDPRIMVTAVICLFFIVLIVVLLHFYARYVLRHQARRLAMARLNLHGQSVETVMQVQARPEPTRTGLDASIIAGLPIFGYMSDGPAVDCPVCLCALEEKEMTRVLPNCKHLFHARCIDMWLHSHLTCPVCRAEAEPRAESETGKAGGDARPPPNLGARAGESVSTLRLSSFRRILSGEWSERSVQVCGQGHAVEDLERQ